MTNSAGNQNGLPELRKWQQDAFTEWIKNSAQGIVEVATAGGKTRFAIECIKHIEKNFDNNLKVVIITPTTALADQWAITLTDDLGIQQTEINIWPESRDSTIRYQIMIINTARKELPKIIAKYPNNFVIADECHRYASEENSKAFEKSFTRSLGLTATADREFDDGLNQILKPALGEIIYEYNILDASRDQIVAPFELINVEVPLDDLEEKSFNKLSYLIAKSYKENNPERAKILSMRRSSIAKNSIHRIPICVELVKNLPDEKIVIFHESIERAEEIQSRLTKIGMSVGIYHSEISGPRRRENLRQFKKGILRIIIACRALDEGVDIPDANIAIVVASTSSHRQRVQRIGRVIRKHPNKEYASIYTFYSSTREATNLIEEMNRLGTIAPTKWLKARTNG